MLRVKQPLYNVSVGRLSPLPPGVGCYSPTIPIRGCSAQRGPDFWTPDLKRGIHFSDVS